MSYNDVRVELVDLRHESLQHFFFGFVKLDDSLTKSVLEPGVVQLLIGTEHQRHQSGVRHPSKSPIHQQRDSLDVGTPHTTLQDGFGHIYVHNFESRGSYHLYLVVLLEDKVVDTVHHQLHLTVGDHLLLGNPHKVLEIHPAGALDPLLQQEVLPLGHGGTELAAVGPTDVGKDLGVCPVVGVDDLHTLQTARGGGSASDLAGGEVLDLVEVLGLVGGVEVEVEAVSLLDAGVDYHLAPLDGVQFVLDEEVDFLPDGV